MTTVSGVNLKLYGITLTILVYSFMLAKSFGYNLFLYLLFILLLLLIFSQKFLKNSNKKKSKEVLIKIKDLETVLVQSPFFRAFLLFYHTPYQCMSFVVAALEVHNHKNRS